MIINKYYMQIMRAGKSWTRMEIRKRNDSGLILGVMLLLAFMVVFVASAHSCTLTPQMQKAYDQLNKISNGDFKVSVRC